MSLLLSGYTEAWSLFLHGRNTSKFFFLTRLIIGRGQERKRISFKNIFKLWLVLVQKVAWRSCWIRINILSRWFQTSIHFCWFLSIWYEINWRKGTICPNNVHLIIIHQVATIHNILKWILFAPCQVVNLFLVVRLRCRWQIIVVLNWQRRFLVHKLW